mmetsp:Transcript_10643/g.15016  ORF Transcript_10643/g.15016 Transcript_10643/m.15016 type:complete len:80 (+) Transcript_10643:237-476(+)
MIIILDLTKDIEILNKSLDTYENLKDEKLSLRLLVGSKIDLCMNDDDFQPKKMNCINWAINNGYEYIETNQLEPFQDMN